MHLKKTMNHLVLTSFFLLLYQHSHASVFRVVIDPGHGGTDEGTVFQQGYERIAEKDITLQLAHQVAKNLESKGFQVTLTRTRDEEIPLPSRTALANKLQADVFISLHMNSTQAFQSRNRISNAEGIETYILNNATDASSRRLAHLENSVITSNDKTITPENWDVALILKDLRLDANLVDSKRLACGVQSELVTVTSTSTEKARRNRGIKQALFHVLLGADMPSVLVEAGFLSNANDRRFVMSQHGQMAMSKAITNALEHYRKYKKSSILSPVLNRCKIN